MLAKDGSFGKQTPNIGSDPLAHTSNRGWILWNTMLAKDGSFGTHCIGTQNANKLYALQGRQDCWALNFK